MYSPDQQYFQPPPPPPPPAGQGYPSSPPVASSAAPVTPSHAFIGSIRAISHSSSSSRSLTGRGHPLLENATFAPPPVAPKTLPYIIAQIKNNRELSSNLPPWDKITHSGTCLARFSVKSMLIKKWKAAFWITVGRSQILFFRTRQDFEECYTNPFLTREAREELVKFNVDFNDDDEKSKTLGYKVTHEQAKSYSREGIMYNFKLERWTSFGPHVVAAFGSKTDHELKTLHSIMSAMLSISPKQMAPDAMSDVSSHYDSDGGRSWNSGRSSNYSSYSARSSKSAPGSKKSFLGRLKDAATLQKCGTDAQPYQIDNNVQSQYYGNQHQQDSWRNYQQPGYERARSAEPKERGRLLPAALRRKKKKAAQGPSNDYYGNQPGQY